MTATEIQIVSVRDLTEMGYGTKQNIYRQMRLGKFPKSIKIGGKTAWRMRSVVEFLRKQENDNK